MLCEVDVLKLLRFETRRYSDVLKFCDVYVSELLCFENLTIRNYYV